MCEISQCVPSKVFLKHEYVWKYTCNWHTKTSRSNIIHLYVRPLCMKAAASSGETLMKGKKEKHGLSGTKENKQNYFERRALHKNWLFSFRFHYTSKRPSWMNFNKGFLISIYCLFLQHGRRSFIFWIPYKWLKTSFYDLHMYLVHFPFYSTKIIKYRIWFRRRFEASKNDSNPLSVTVLQHYSISLR